MARTALTAAALPLLAWIADPLAAQDPVIKPTTTTLSGTRLPAPSTVTGRQLADGRIEVRWSRVAGAARYDIVRSVPNVGVTSIKPGPTDTVYVDAEVKAGYFYYYVVQPIDSTGYPGLKQGSPPVQATISTASAPAQTLMPTSTNDDPTAATGGSTGSTWNVLKSVWVGPWPWRDSSQAVASLGFDYAQGGVYFVIERGTTYPTKGAWQTVQTTRTMPCCGYRGLVDLDRFTEGTKIVYRVTAVDSANPTRKSIPMISNEYTVSFKRLPAPARLTATQQSDGTIRVSWAPVAGAARYFFKAYSGFSRYATLESTDTTFLDRDILSGDRYTYTVSAQSATWVEGLSATTTVTATASAATPLLVSTQPTDEVSVAVGGTYSLRPTLAQTRWFALDEALATVDAAGTITGRSAGSARLIVMGLDEHGVVKVLPYRVLVTATGSPTSR
jgi:fibronectin type 3 domain-containing protein